ncbi:MAG: 50S ribosomal protein L22 [Proteobacteria bacterium]|jgi:large subunit ribosomal protein L22|nr:50S ribosomal protein L22 [Pseudomonadota bacterium]
MQSSASLRYERVAPRKVRVVAKLIHGKSVGEAVNLLMFCEKDAAGLVRKLLVSAIANADQKSSGSVDADSLVVRQVQVDQGPTLKRWRPRAQGRATRINKRTSHIRVVLTDGID